MTICIPVALYFVDWEKEGKSLAVEMFDGKTFELVAPVRIVEDHREGYMQYTNTIGPLGSGLIISGVNISRFPACSLG